jgi:hypothetical protein
LNLQSERYRREGIDLSLSTLADQVGACTTVLRPLHALIEQHVLEGSKRRTTVASSQGAERATARRIGDLAARAARSAVKLVHGRQAD